MTQEGLQAEWKGSQLAELLSDKQRSMFVYEDLRAVWIRPTHIMEGSLLCSKSTNLDVNLTQKHLHRNTQYNA